MASKWTKCSSGVDCAGCDATLEENEDVQLINGEIYCEGCVEEGDEYESECGYDEELIDGVGFADPGGNSALRASTRDNPRILPCPTCETENVLTPADVARGYQCDRCADRAEGHGGEY